MQKGPALASRAAWAAREGSSRGSRPPWPSQPRRTARHHPPHTDTHHSDRDHDDDDDEDDDEDAEDDVDGGEEEP